MNRKALVQPKIIIGFLLLQILPLIMLPPSSYNLETQEWWLPVLLAFLALVATFQLVVRRSIVSWPWYLVSFAQGFNIISRLMMLMPHAMQNKGGVMVMDWLYLTISVLSMAFSAFILWYTELPEVRLGLIKE